MPRTEYEILTVRVMNVTADAILIIDEDLKDGTEFWVPKSCVEDGSEYEAGDSSDDEYVDMHVALWWLRDKFPGEYR